MWISNDKSPSRRRSLGADRNKGIAQKNKGVGDDYYLGAIGISRKVAEGYYRGLVGLLLEAEGELEWLICASMTATAKVLARLQRNEVITGLLDGIRMFLIPKVACNIEFQELLPPHLLLQSELGNDFLDKVTLIFRQGTKASEDF